jgi:plasmid stabilization system protein ParE
MALKIEVKKRFINSMKKVHEHLEKKWSAAVADEFNRIADEKIKKVARQPDIGNVTAIANVRSVLAGKGYQNRIYYRVTKDRLIIINMIDTRKNPKKNPFNKAV